MGAKAYELPSGSGLIKGTAKETGSELGKYTGGNLLGWSIYAKEKAKLTLYDNAEKAEGTNYGIISLNKEESIRDWFGNGIGFSNALYCKINEGSVEGIVYCDVE